MECEDVNWNSLLMFSDENFQTFLFAINIEKILVHQRRKKK